jgi:acyl-CoA synthetase (NDP forming)
VQAKRTLAAIGVRTPAEFFARTAGQAQSQAASFEGLLALKVVSGDLTHKSDVGGVALRVAPGEVGVAVERMAQDVARLAPQAWIEGYLVTEMVGGGVEVIVGAKRDPLFGQVVLVGLGGVFAEIFKDVSLRLAPVTQHEARAMIGELKSFPLLMGYRGKPAADIDALAEIVAALSRFAAANADSIASMEINPVMVLPAGQGALALDAVIETEPVAAAIGDDARMHGR